MPGLLASILMLALLASILMLALLPSILLPATCPALGGCMRTAARNPSSLASSTGGRSARLGVSAALVVATLACRDTYRVPTANTPAIDPVAPIAPVYGSVMVRAVTSGENLDPDGFVVQFDGPWDYEHGPTPVATNGTATLTHLSPGNHARTLDVAGGRHIA
jgi:hypothetical protein